MPFISRIPSKIVIIENFQWFGLIATIFLLSGVLSSTIGFKGMKKEPFSFLNHFISELGDPRFATHYRLFNITLFISGILMIPFVIGLGLLFNSGLGIFISIAGVFCALSCSLIGVFAEHKIKTHFAIAGCFFVGMAILMLVSTIGIYLQSDLGFPLWFIFISILLMVFFSSFIIDTVRLSEKELKITDEPWTYSPERPIFWRNPFLEWCAFFSIIVWLSLIVIVVF